MNLLASVALSVALNETDARKVAALVQRVVDAEAEVVRLAALFQQTHGVHHDWVATGARLQAEVERLREALARTRSHVIQADVALADALATTSAPSPPAGKVEP